MKKKIDFKYVVVGSGPAGATIALLLAKAKEKVAIIEGGRWGGADLNTRDVPYSAMLNFAHLYANAKSGARIGLSSSELSFNFPSALSWKDGVVDALGQNTKKTLADAGVTCIDGYANFLGPNEVAVGEQRIRATYFIIATGSSLDDSSIRGTEIVDCILPERAMNIRRVPRAVMVVGGGATGCELAQFFAELGAKVLLAEAGDHLLPKEDVEVGQRIEELFTKQYGITVLSKSPVIAVEQDELSKRVVFSYDGHEKLVRVDSIVLATGSKSNVEIGLENAGIKVSRRGLVVNKNFQTSAKHIFAIGDVLGGESSTERGIYQARLLFSYLNRHVNCIQNYDGFMRVVDTYPSVACLGQTEDVLLKKGRKYKRMIIPASMIKAAKTQNADAGFVKLLVDKNNKILGASVMAPGASVVAQELALAIRHHIGVAELASTPCDSNNWGELVGLAAKAINKQPK